MAKLMAIKPLKQLLAEANEEGDHSLKRALGPVNLMTLGVGAIIGTGIFVLVGPAAAAAMMANVVTKLDPNQSSCWPLSRITCKQPMPRTMSDSPM